MDTRATLTKCKNHRFPVERISHAVWVYVRFRLSFREGEARLSERGVVVTYEAIWKWCWKFGQPMPINSDVAVLHLGIRGTWMRYF